MVSSRGHEEEMVNGEGSDGMNFDGRPRVNGGGSEHFAGRGAWRGEAWTMHGCAVDGWGKEGGGRTGSVIRLMGMGSGGHADAMYPSAPFANALREGPPRTPSAHAPPSAPFRALRALRASVVMLRLPCVYSAGTLRLFRGCFLCN